MRTGRPRVNQYNSNYQFSVLGCIVRTLIGFALAAPFMWHVCFGAHEPSPSTWTIISIWMWLFGAPYFILGVFGLVFKKQHAPDASLQLDIMRIRQAVETKMTYDIFKDIRKGE